ncbi:MAG: hypothetical protein LBN04_01905 [Oscillospiraceae bacterium]|jgi:hypothetical protein|nr:hypothetical protein [Oscillospiraceae bacterium]
MSRAKRMAIGALAQSDWAAVLQESQPDIEFPTSIQETMPFEPLALAPEQLIETLRAGELNETLAQAGIVLPFEASSANLKRQLFLDSQVAGALADIETVTFGEAEAWYTCVFTNTAGQWRLTDVLPRIESVEIQSNSHNSWLVTTAYAFGMSVRYEGWYNVANRRYDLQYIGNAGVPAYDESMAEGVAYTSAYCTISEYSEMIDGQSINKCYLYHVKNESLCAWTPASIEEVAAFTQIDVYAYDYVENTLTLLGSRAFENIGAATIDSLLRAELLLDDVAVFSGR